MKIELKTLRLPLKALSVSMLLMVSSCSQEELLVPKEENSTTDARLNLLPSNAGNMKWNIITNGIEANNNYEPEFTGEIAQYSGTPIVEAGFVTSHNVLPNGAITVVPVYASTPFNSIYKVLSNNSNIGPGKFKLKIPFKYNEVYYRSYIKLKNGSIQYGDVKYQKAWKIGPAGYSTDQNKNYFFQGSVDQEGSVKAVEIGFVESFRNTPNGAIINNPVYANNLFNGTYPARAYKDNIAYGYYKLIIPFLFTEIYIRGYVKLEDGTVVYGEISHFKK
ncbi:hypothetical protein [Dyadobacter sediminis]|uniref:Uncharacterized protein n=1 Tax=Dyadobacter sediminis TaxID=1493691 RepID=A0A5R9KDT2_9BACT|nr:hypothetical protein [Dyadobacter sediminis]TLU94294.1 hypothetical protein FEM55_08560 [Dyadobacter sediminis]GGB92516.1 hypothetical protein GCM10011325_19950 [Dyadobacter sediminis]